MCNVGKCCFKYLYKKSTPVVDGLSWSFTRKSQRSAYELQAWRNDPNLTNSEDRENIFPSALILREMGNKKYQSVKNGHWGSKVWEWLSRSLLGEKKNVERISKSAFSSSQMRFSSCLRSITSITLVHPFVFFLLFVWPEMLIKPRNRMRLDQEGLKKISSSSSTITCWVQKTV